MFSGTSMASPHAAGVAAAVFAILEGNNNKLSGKLGNNVAQMVKKILTCDSGADKPRLNDLLSISDYMLRHDRAFFQRQIEST